jgi:hypothetical protein
MATKAGTFVTPTAYVGAVARAEQSGGLAGLTTPAINEHASRDNSTLKASSHMRGFIPAASVALTVIVGGWLVGVAGTRLSAPSPADSARIDSIARVRQDSINRTLPGYVIDSILPRGGAPPLSARRCPVTAPSGLWAAVRRAKRSCALRSSCRRKRHGGPPRDGVRGREFADLYYPESPYARPPYHQAPALAWNLIQNPSSAGLTKLLHRFGGKRMIYVSSTCDPKIAHDGATTRYAGCLVRVIDEAGDSTTKRLFGSIVARGGQYKFLSYTNNF